MKTMIDPAVTTFFDDPFTKQRIQQTADDFEDWCNWLLFHKPLIESGAYYRLNADRGMA